MSPHDKDADSPYEEDSEETPTPVERSALALELAELKSTVMRFAEERERLPQPLFWSLFRSRIDKARKEKEIKRVLGELLGEGD